MMTRRHSVWLIATWLAVSVGCASAPTPITQNGLDIKAATQESGVIAEPASEAASVDDGMRCTSYRPTGSHRKITRCISREQQQLERDAARRTLSGAQGPAVSAPSDL